MWLSSKRCPLFSLRGGALHERRSVQSAPIVRDYCRAAKGLRGVFLEFSFESIFRLILPSILVARELRDWRDVEGLGLLADEHPGADQR